MLETLRAARRKLGRDRELPLGLLLRKAARYAREVGLAPLYLRAVDELGRGVRTYGRPRVENLGHMAIGGGTLVRSVNVPVELATGVGATLRVGRDCSLNYGVSLGATGSITLGDRVRLGPYTMVVDSDFHDPYDRQVRPAPRPVVLEDDVWVGAKACVMPGVRIGRGAIVGTGAVVTRDVAPFQVVAGVPAKVIRTLDAARFVSQEA